MEIYVSTGSGIEVLSDTGDLLRQTSLPDVHALCVSGDHLLCASQAGRAVWRLNRRTLMPLGLFPGGPGVCDLLASSNGACLYVLCGEADSVMRCDAVSGQPLLLNRAGVNPRQMALCGDRLAVAGGESGCVHLFDAESLRETSRISMPGPVHSVVLSRDALQALCLTPTLDSLLVTRCGEESSALGLPGLPGRLMMAGNTLLLLDDLGERLFALDARLGERRLLHARALAVCAHTEG